MYDLEMLEAWHEYNEHNLPLTFAEFCYQKGRADAMDELVKFANTLPTIEDEYGEIRPMWLEEMVEQLKEQNK